MTETGTVTNRAELLAYTEAQWQRFVGYTDALPDEVWEGPTDAAGWSVKDHVAHVALQDRAEVALLRHGTPVQESLKVSDEAWADETAFLINEEVRRQTIDHTPAEVRAERDRVYRELFALISDFSDEDLARPSTEFGFDEADVSLLTMFTWVQGDHFEEHRGWIQVIVEEAGG